MTNLEEGFEITGLYRQRGLIAQMFRTFKTRGFDVEAPREKLHPLTDVFIAADKTLIESLSASLEGKTARQKTPHPKTLLAFAARVCARLGGWTGYFVKPGPVTIMRGNTDLKAASRGAIIIKRTRDM